MHPLDYESNSALALEVTKKEHIRFFLKCITSQVSESELLPENQHANIWFVKLVKLLFTISTLLKK